MKTPSGSLRIERAQIGDVAGIIDLFEAAAVWLEAQGVFQWSTRVSPHFRKFLRQKVMEGNVFVAQGRDGRLLGHIRFDFEAGKVWHDNPAETAYVRGLVIANEVRGQGVGTALLDWAQVFASEKGCVRLRLDCLAENGRLRQYYRDYGFTFLGEGRSGRYTAALFELSLA
jgi:ribosomal protein S18 acetylase RimI-like enzyme